MVHDQYKMNQLAVTIFWYSMSQFTHWVVADDTIADVNYLGSWFAEVGSWDSIGTSGMPYLGTLHGTSSSASFTFNFQGSGIRVVGSISSANSAYWTCSVDGIIMNTRDPFAAPRNNFELCFLGWLDDKNHTLTVNATPSSNQTFWLDRIEYVPSQRVSLDQKAIGVALNGPGLDSSAQTVFVYTFYGVSVSWYGTIFTSTPGNLSWSMDNADPTYISNWIRPPAANATDPLLNQKFFTTPTYPIGTHTLKVSYIANRETTPLGFDYLIVQNGTVPSRSESSNPHNTGSTSGTPGTVARGLIAGGVTIGILLFIIAVLVFYFCRRRLDSTRMEVYSDEPIPFNQPQRPAYISPQTQTHPVQRKSRMFSSHLQSTAASLPPSNHNRTNTMNESPTSLSSRLSAQYIGDHSGQPMPSSAHVLDLGEGSNLVPGPSRIVVHKDSGMRFNGEALPTPITL